MSARRRRSRSRTAALPRAREDRRTVTVDGKTREVEYRPDALARLYARGVLDLQQHEAGVRLRQLIEAAQVSPVTAQEYDRVYLDPDVVRAAATGLAPRAGEALKELTALKRRMGSPDWPIVTAIVWEDAYFSELLQRNPESLIRYTERTIGARVAEAFDRLARSV